jgi:hypothetical protein
LVGRNARFWIDIRSRYRNSPPRPGMALRAYSPAPRIC